MANKATKLEANWKTQFQILWNSTPKEARKTIEQINSIISRSKLSAVLNKRVGG